MSRYIVPGIIGIIIIFISVLYVTQEPPSGLSDSPQIIDDTSLGMSLNTTVSPSDVVTIDDLEYYIDEDGTKHYSISASDSPVPGN